MRKKPLSGKTILVTRAREQSADFASRLERLGAEVIPLPMIEIVPPRSWEGMDRAISSLRSYDWIIFTSVNGVAFFFDRLKEMGKTPRSLSKARICAIGPATAEALRKRGVRVEYIPKQFVAESILRGLKRKGIEGKRILLARAERAREVLPEGLQSMGARVDQVEAYRTVKPKGASIRLKKLLGQRKVDVVTFTSSSTVHHFIDLLKGEEVPALLKGVAIACIGPVTAESAREAGLRVHIQPEVYTIPALTRAIERYFRREAYPPRRPR
ncbi:MAG: uroporphyrinogen-III synthase [Desulfobacterota bacterium]|nr:uroporphyrinogen-III synthase [Thermodesulfobacteriota bacterium]